MVNLRPLLLRLVLGHPGAFNGLRSCLPIGHQDASVEVGRQIRLSKVLEHPSDLTGHDPGQ